MAEVAERPTAPARRERIMKAAEDAGLLGTKGTQLGGRFPGALVEEARRITGIAETTELLTYALAKVALEDDFGERLVKRKGSVPKGTLSAG